MGMEIACTSPLPRVNAGFPGRHATGKGPIRRVRVGIRYMPHVHNSACLTRRALLGMLLVMVLNLPALAQVQPAPEFPRDFSGHWKGVLMWYPADKPVQSVDMQLIIQPLDTPGRYSWRMVYGKPGEDERPYTLQPVDSAKGHWVVDEHNGILLDGFWRGNRFTSVFSVQGTVITEVMWLENDALQVEFISHGEAPVRESGGNGPEIPKARSFQLRGYQRAMLYRNK